jgi:hypothetical protein
VFTREYEILMKRFPFFDLADFKPHSKDEREFRKVSAQKNNFVVDCALKDGYWPDGNGCPLLGLRGRLNADQGNSNAIS